MFKCRCCEALKAENERLHKLVERLLDKAVGPVIPEGAEDGDLGQRPPPFEREEIKDDDGNLVEVVERHLYGGE